MRITVSSPDGLGDFILRIPMLRALEAAGHQLQLFMRRPAAELAEEFFPHAELHVIGADPYLPRVRRRRHPFRAEHEAIQRFTPDLYIAALFALSFFDEIWLQREEPSAPAIGFSTSDPFWPATTIADPRALAARFRTRVEVPVALPEIEKNRRLAATILGREVDPETPRIGVREDHLEAARELLRAHGLAEGEYWVACVGGRVGLRMKDWGEDNWRLLFTRTVERAGAPIVFLGNTREWESIERIRSDAYRSVNLAVAPPSISVSLALVAMSRGYVGRDSGVMHLAAAEGRPVFAVFGGPHWGRFLPVSGPAVVVTQATSCRGCDSACPHDQPHCVQDIEMPFMIDAWRRFLASASGVEVCEQPEPPALALANARLPADFALRAGEELRRREARTRAGLWRRLFPAKSLR